MARRIYTQSMLDSSIRERDVCLAAQKAAEQRQDVLVAQKMKALAEEISTRVDFINAQMALGL